MELRRDVLRNRDVLDEVVVLILTVEDGRYQVIEYRGPWGDYEYDTIRLSGMPHRKYLFTGWGIAHATSVIDSNKQSRRRKGYSVLHVTEPEKEKKTVNRIRRTILRNRTTRKDAAYVVDIVEVTKGDYRVYTYWGPWESYEKDTVELSGLQVKELAVHPFRSRAIETADNQVNIKARRSYRVHAEQGEGDIEYWVDYRESEPEPEPEPEPEKYAEDHIYHRLFKRSG